MTKMRRWIAREYEIDIANETSYRKMLRSRLANPKITDGHDVTVEMLDSGVVVADGKVMGVGGETGLLAVARISVTGQVEQLPLVIRRTRRKRTANIIGGEGS